MRGSGRPLPWEGGLGWVASPLAAGVGGAGHSGGAVWASHLLLPVLPAWSSPVGCAFWGGGGGGFVPTPYCFLKEARCRGDAHHPPTTPGLPGGHLPSRYPCYYCPSPLPRPFHYIPLKAAGLGKEGPPPSLLSAPPPPALAPGPPSHTSFLIYFFF